MRVREWGEGGGGTSSLYSVKTSYVRLFCSYRILKNKHIFKSDTLDQRIACNEDNATLMASNFANHKSCDNS